MSEPCPAIFPLQPFNIPSEWLNDEGTRAIEAISRCQHKDGEGHDGKHIIYAIGGTIEWSGTEGDDDE